MAPSYDSAVAELYQAPHASFVEERKRLATELKTSGDKAGAAQLAKLGRPPISAWAVNQLWWHARDAFEALFASAARLRDGDLGATAAHREALTNLRVRATAMLSDAGHGTTETTLRRVSLTLSALAAIGSFDPDPPGALSADRDPPGFEALGILPSPVAAPAPAPAPTPAPTPAPVAKLVATKPVATKPVATKPVVAEAPAAPTGASALSALVERKKRQSEAATDAATQRWLENKRKWADEDAAEASATTQAADAAKQQAAEAAKQQAAEAKRQAAEEAAARAEIEATRRRIEETRSKRSAERQRLEAALRTAQGDVASREREATRLRTQLLEAEQAIEVAKEIVADLKSRLDGLPAD